MSATGQRQSGCYTRSDAGSGAGSDGGASKRQVHTWELVLIAKVANRFRTSEREDLRAELAFKLLVLKWRASPAVRDWTAYVTRFLTNKAANWTRDWRAQQRRAVHCGCFREDVTDGERSYSLEASFGLRSDDDTALAFGAMWNDLDRETQTLWRTLLEEGGNQTRTARQTHKHRNTVRVKILGIRKILERHGFAP